MQLITKFWKTKAFSVACSLIATVVVWSALAWPDWTSKPTVYAGKTSDDAAAALRYLAAVDASKASPPLPTAVPQPQVIRQAIVVKAPKAAPQIVYVDGPTSTGSAAAAGALPASAAEGGTPAGSSQSLAPASSQPGASAPSSGEPSAPPSGGAPQQPPAAVQPPPAADVPPPPRQPTPVQAPPPTVAPPPPPAPTAVPQPTPVPSTGS